MQVGESIEISEEIFASIIQGPKLSETRSRHEVGRPNDVARQ
jgi:hypothetical protein